MRNLFKSSMEADPTDDILGPKKRNYQFLQFVRLKNYPEALLLGKLSKKTTIKFSRMPLTIPQSANS